MTGAVDIRPLTEADDIDAELDLRRRAFGPISGAARPEWVAAVQASIRAGTLIGVFDGKRLVASARYHPMRQWWRGRSMPMAGVAGVKVAPEVRGRGTGKAMMTTLLTELSRREYPVSVLFPSTVPLYRSLGWELAGGRYETYLPARSLAQLAPPDPLLFPDGEPAPNGQAAADGLRRAEPGDEATVSKIIGRVATSLRQCGPSTRDAAELEGWFDDEDEFAYLADDGFLSYRWSRGHDEMDVHWMVAGSAATARAFWTILASHASMAERVRTCLAPDDPVAWLTREADATLRTRSRWMLRLLDAPAAIAGRGFPAGTTVSVPLELTDQQVPANAGRWQLTIEGGAGKLDRIGDATRQPDDSLRLSARGLAALYAGLPLGTLRLAGLAAGRATNDDALDGAFACNAFMIDSF